MALPAEPSESCGMPRLAAWFWAGVTAACSIAAAISLTRRERP